LIFSVSALTSSASQCGEECADLDAGVNSGRVYPGQVSICDVSDSLARRSTSNGMKSRTSAGLNR